MTPPGPGSGGIAADRPRRQSDDPAIEDAPPSVRAMVGTLLERRYRLDAILDVHQGVCRLQSGGGVHGDPVDVRVAPVEASEATRVAFSREAELLARLDHQACPRVSEFGSLSDGTLFLVVSPAPPTKLKSLFGAPMDIDAALDLATQLLDALQHLHVQGVVHGAVSGRSVRLAAEGDRMRVHLEDFSQARLAGASGDAGVHDDVAQAGLLVYQLLAGRAPFPDPASATPRPMPTSVPRALAGVITRMFATNPALRFSDAHAASSALRTWDDEATLALVDDVADAHRDDEFSTAVYPPSSRVSSATVPARESAATPLPPEPRTQVVRVATPIAAPIAAPIADPRLARMLNSTFDATTGQSIVGPSESVDDALGLPPRRWGRWLGAVALVGAAAGVVLMFMQGPRPNAPDAPSAVAGEPAAGRDADRVTGEPPAAVAVALPVGQVVPPADLGIDLMEQLARVNNPDLGAAPSWQERHAFLDRLRASTNTAAMIDVQLNAILDLLQASAATEPCATFDHALSALEGELSDGSRARLRAAAVTVPDAAAQEAPDACAGHQDRLAALMADGTPGRQAAPERRARSSRRSIAASSKAVPAPAMMAPSKAASGPARVEPSRSPASSKKLDDELRPFAGTRG